MRHAIDMTGARAGSLTVLARAEGAPDPKAQAAWACKCDCGICCTVRGATLRRAQASGEALMCRRCKAAAREAGAPTVKRLGRPKAAARCPRCGATGEGGRRWLTAHRRESPECSGRGKRDHA